MQLELEGMIVTGGFGFIGSNFIHHLFSGNLRANQIINIDHLGYGSNPNNLNNISSSANYKHYKTDINNIDCLEETIHNTRINLIINFAAETHVDRSISNPSHFIHSNINGVFRLLEFCRKHDIEKFIQISTDEVYGDAEIGQRFTERDVLKPSSPYSASKAAADLLVQAYFRSYGIKTIITRCTNNFGPYQFPEKLIPKSIIRAVRGLPIPIYGDGNQIREWLYVIDHISAILSIIAKGKAGEVYNISSSNELSNLDVISKIKKLLKVLKGINVNIEHVQDRPGHDRRYSLNSTKLTDELGWKPIYDFDKTLEDTVKWYIHNEWWWEPLVNESVLHPQPWKLNWK